MDSRKINNCNTLLYHLLKYCLVLYLCQEEMVVDLRKQLEEVLSQHSEQLQMRETMCGQQKRKITEHFLHEIKNLNRQCQVLSYHHHHHHCHHHHMQRFSDSDDSIFHGQGDSSMCVQSLGWTLN